jgi:hypothetical protein
MPDRPLAVDLFCGLGGWAQGFLAECYRVVGFDTEGHDYGDGCYPGELVRQDVLTPWLSDLPGSLRRPALRLGGVGCSG